MSQECSGRRRSVPSPANGRRPCDRPRVVSLPACPPGPRSGAHGGPHTSRTGDNVTLSINGRQGRLSGVTTTDTLSRPRRTIETREFCAMMRRMINAHTRRVAAGSAEDLADLVALRADLDKAIDDAARALHDGTDTAPGLSWTDIARVLGVSRQAARQRFGA